MSKRRIRIANDRPASRHAIEKVSAALHASFESLATSIVNRAWSKIEHLSAAPKKKERYFFLDHADEVIREIDFDGPLDDVVPRVTAHMVIAASDSADAALAQSGAYGRALAKEADVKAVEIATERGAALVGKRFVDGELVDNPDAEYSITDTTRESIREVIAEGFRYNKTVDEISADIVSSTALSKERADMIAQHEVYEINNSVALSSYKIARDQGGVKLKKVWETSGDDNVCDDCAGNEAAGEIDLDDDFPSGHDAPPLHVRCNCNVTAVADESDTGEED